MDAVTGAESDGGEWNDRVVREKGETKAFGDAGENEGGFHQREGVADALARAEAEREVGEAGYLLEQVAFPAFGEKLFGILIPAGIAVDDVGDGGDAGALRNGIAGEFVIFDG